MSEKLQYQFMGCVEETYYWVAATLDDGMSVIACPKELFWGSTGAHRELALHQRACRCTGCLLREAREWKLRLEGTIFDGE